MNQNTRKCQIINSSSFDPVSRNVPFSAPESMLSQVTISILYGRWIVIFASISTDWVPGLSNSIEYAQICYSSRTKFRQIIYLSIQCIMNSRVNAHVENHKIYYCVSSEIYHLGAISLWDHIRKPLQYKTIISHIGCSYRYVFLLVFHIVRWFIVWPFGTLGMIKIRLFLLVMFVYDHCAGAIYNVGLFCHSQWRNAIFVKPRIAT